ncbi:TetR family transcriptional regulator [Aestuariivirga sp.]|uniref:TetR family transcriptional regulator n=1 Tax=Aestuariivirga sp. TaxID=2650926 RepID=UPI00391D8D53
MDTPAPRRRKASRSHRREQLIEATISTIAQRGLAQTTLSSVARAAGVSHGLVIFYFESKERLLAETLRFMSDVHRRHWETAIEQAGPAPEERLLALILSEFDDALYTQEWLTAWCGFWGEAQSRPLYLTQSGENDRAYIEIFETLSAELAHAGGYPIEPGRAARVLRLTIEGVWLELMFSAKPYSREEALNTVLFCAGTLFPHHFGPGGPVSR